MSDATGAGGDAASSTRHLRTVAGREIAFDGEGFFWDFDEWSEEAARELAAESGLAELDDEHWKVLRFFRDYFAYHGRAPLNRDIKKGTGFSLLELQGMFPGGLKEGARRLAGLPNPKSCN
ncbi:MAG: TusE/DsrC/DsvC family sulfur relay protein [Desulfarculaceae bacterium]|nr:TusE/DsrC/DsvC family sulfur relay protein [Desulfarculaceae bacterium]